MTTHRTESKWEERYAQDWARRLFTPRLREDLEQIPIPKNLPRIDWDSGKGLYIYGPAGTGKTVLSAQILFMEKRQQYLEGASNIGDEWPFIYVPDLFAQLKNTFSANHSGEPPGPGDTEYGILNRLKSAPLLVLDEFGVSGKPSEWVLQVLYMLINHRYEYLKPTIMTSNYSLRDLARELGDDRVTSRIERMCRVVQKGPWH